MSPIMNNWPTLLRYAGILLLVAGLQAWGFNRQVTPLVAEAHEQLLLLQNEVPANRLANLSLQSLQLYSNTTEAELTQRQVLELRDSVLHRFDADPQGAVSQFAQVVRDFESRTAAEQDVLSTLQRQTTQLERMYADHFDDTIIAVTHPAWYLQPTAAFLNNDQAQSQALQFNHALYLMHVRKTSAAVEILDSLRSDEALQAKALFTLSRIQYRAFRLEKDPSYFQDALQLAQQSVRSDASHALAKLFLDYLLSIDQQAVEVDESPIDSEGTGEGEGERGAIGVDPGEF
jgi:tetratricopeptide (TPR) repeat protein